MRNLRKSPGPSLDAIVRELQIFNQRLKSGLIDTSTPEFAAAMTKVIQLQLLRLGDDLKDGRIDIRSNKFQDFLRAWAILGTPARKGRRPPRTS